MSGLDVCDAHKIINCHHKWRKKLQEKTAQTHERSRKEQISNKKLYHLLLCTCIHFNVDPFCHVFGIFAIDYIRHTLLAQMATLPSLSKHTEIEIQVRLLMLHASVHVSLSFDQVHECSRTCNWRVRNNFHLDKLFSILTHHLS